MDKKKKMTRLLIATVVGLLSASQSIAQTPAVAGMEFCERSYEYGIGNDSIHLYVNFLDSEGNRVSNIRQESFNDLLYVMEDGKEIEGWNIKPLSSGVRIPREYTFSILLDQSIPAEGKRQILDALDRFLEVTPDSSVYVSYFGDEVSPSMMVGRDGLGAIREKYMESVDGKVLYSGVYAKLSEFDNAPAEYADEIVAVDYENNPLVSTRAAMNPGKNILMIFADASRRPDIEDIDFIKVTDYQTAHASAMPKVNAFYYKGEASSDDEDAYDGIEVLLQGLTEPKDVDRRVIPQLKGTFKPSGQMSEMLATFETVVDEATYDYMISLKASPDKSYTGNVVYSARWGKNQQLGEQKFTIGSAEHPWPDKPQSTTGIVVEVIVAILVTLLTFLVFFLIMKILVPYIKSVSFKSKYYKPYVPEENVSRRICHYCKQDLKPGQIIVKKCSHWMHKHCWEENGYKCAEFGQNCKTGIQDHIEWKELFKWHSIKECSQTIAGILAGLVSWIIYEACGRGGFTSISEWIVSLVFDADGAQASIVSDCVTRTSSFLMIGLLLGFFISLVFRYKDDVRNKDWKVWLKIVGYSVLTALIGMLAFAIGADIMCLILSWGHMTYIPWYCSLPAYVLFSLSVSLALTIKSTIPVKSALIGGLCSAAIGFLVLYFTNFTSSNYNWLNMLLDFIIYGGGLGASLVTVRMLAERYFLVIQNGVKAGQRIPIHKWMNATGGGNKVSIGMTGDCEIQMNWEKSNKVAKEHARLYIDHDKNLPVIKPLATGVLYNSRADLPVNKAAVLSNGDTFKIGDTIFKYEEA